MHTGVGVGVARSTVMGNAKASECGTSDKRQTHAFFVPKCHTWHGATRALNSIQDSCRSELPLEFSAKYDRHSQTSASL